MADDSMEGYSPEEIASMAATYNGLLKNPETREVTLRATKKLNPSLSIPEVDLKDQARGAFAAHAKEIDALKLANLERESRDRIKSERAELREQGFSAEDVTAIEKIMMDERIPSYATASKYYRNERTLAEPTPNAGVPESGTTWDLPQEPLAALKGGKAGLAKWARQQAEASLSDIRSGRIKLH